VIRRTGIVVSALATVAHADLYAVGNGENYCRAYYRISTTDASITLLGEHPTQDFLWGDIALASDGRYYAVSWSDFERIDPVTGDAELLHPEGRNVYMAAGLTVTTDGVAYFSLFTTIGQDPYALVWDTEIDDIVGSIVWDIAGGFNAIALHERSDGVLLATQFDDPFVYQVDTRTGHLSPLGGFDPPVGDVLSFAMDPVTGQCYMLAEQSGQTRLYAVDLFAFDAMEIGTVPANILGIAGIACPADFNGDGSLDVLDFVALQQAWQAGDDAADVNGDGVLDLLDFVAFQTVFQEGCA